MSGTAAVVTGCFVFDGSVTALRPQGTDKDSKRAQIVETPDPHFLVRAETLRFLATLALFIARLHSFVCTRGMSP